MIPLDKDSLSQYSQALLSGEAELVYKLYLDGKFATECGPFDFHTVYDAYSPLGSVKIESYLRVRTNNSLGGSSGYS
jgi:hypothetical protein